MLNNIFTLWMTGLSGSGKTTLAYALKEYYNKLVILDGDEIRKGLCSDLEFTSDDRSENIRRVAEVSKMFNKNGLQVVVSFITPFEKDRNIIRNIIGDKFRLCYVKCSLETCEDRDVKGLYKKVRNGEIKDFTGIDSPYEIPINPNIVIDSETKSIKEATMDIFQYLVKENI